MNQVRCKVLCIKTGTEQTAYPASSGVGKANEPQHVAEFQAVYSNDPNSENAQFFKYTPNLTLKTGIINAQHFEAGKEYYIDFSPAEATAS